MTNDKVFQLDITFRATDRRNCRVIEWVDAYKKLPNEGQIVLAINSHNSHSQADYNMMVCVFENKRFMIDHFCEQSDMHEVTHWADISNFKPSEDL